MELEALAADLGRIQISVNKFLCPVGTKRSSAHHSSWIWGDQGSYFPHNSSSFTSFYPVFLFFPSLYSHMSILPSFLSFFLLALFHSLFFISTLPSFYSIQLFLSFFVSFLPSLSFFSKSLFPFFPSIFLDFLPFLVFFFLNFHSIHFTFLASFSSLFPFFLHSVFISFLFSSILSFHQLCNVMPTVTTVRTSIYKFCCKVWYIVMIYGLQCTSWIFPLGISVSQVIPF